MKNKSREIEEDDPLDHEIDFSKSRPNPYWLGIVDRRCVRLLDKDLTEMFPDDASVNAALRTIAEAANRAAAPAPKTVSARRAAAPKRARKKVQS